MLTPNAIADRLEELIRGEFAGETVYRELVESDFQRPSNLIVQEKAAGWVDAAAGMVKINASFTVTTYVTTDPYGNSHLEELHRRQMRILKLLMPGYIKVSDRAPKVSGEIKLDGGYDYDTVTVTFEYYLNRSDFTAMEQLPVMGELHMARNKEE